MSAPFAKVISFILDEYFGENIQKVGDYLFKWGPSPLALIAKGSGLNVEQTKCALCFLIKYNFVKFARGKTESVANYHLDTENVYQILRYPRYFLTIRKRFGNEAERLLEKILLKGTCSASEAILATHRDNAMDVTKLRDTFISLVNGQYLIRIVIPTEEMKVPDLTVTVDSDLFQPPKLTVRQLLEASKTDQNNVATDDAYWRVNMDRFHQDMRDELLIEAVRKRVDDTAADIFQMLLKLMYVRTQTWSSVSNPVPVLELKDLVKKTKGAQMVKHLEQYLTIIEEDPCKFIRRIGDAGGGQYVVNLRQIVNELVWTTVENLIEARFESSSARIFRLIRQQKYIEIDNIQRKAMIPAKDAKRLTYQLLEENFIQTRELRKPANNGPVKAFTLFHINIDQIVRMVLNLTYKSMFNLKSRRKHLTVVNKPIIDKKLRAEAIEVELKLKSGDQTEEEIENMICDLITPAEREILNKIGTNSQKLNSVTLLLDDTVFLLQLFIMHNTRTGVVTRK